MMYSLSRSFELHPLTIGLTLLVASTVGVCSGCAGRSIQADNPVLSATPPRIRSGLAQQEADPSSGVAPVAVDIEQASFVDSRDVAIDGENAGIAATVNGTPILVSDVLLPYTPKLKVAQQQLPEAEFTKIKRELIERELPSHVEQAILVDSALSQLKPEQQGMLEEQLETYFGEYLQQKQAEMGASSLAELEGILQQAGTSITNLQRAFNNHSLADQSMKMLIEKQPEPLVNRAELLAEYEQRTEEFTEPEQVKWQQIRITYMKHGGKSKAFEIVDEVVIALKQGASFDDVAKQHSDDVKASDGGHWDWTQRGQLANEQIDKMLFELKVGEIGQVVTSDSAFHIVRVTDRKAQTTKSFAEVQDQLTREIKRRKQQLMLEQIEADLKKEAVVTTMFDEQE